jgi:ribonuclease P protein component
MITNANRFHGYNSLRNVYRKGETVRGPQLAIKYVVNTKRKTFRMGVVVSKKVSKSAVVRNRIRRRLYEVVRTLPAPPGKPYDLVFMVYSDQLAEMPYPELQLLVRDVLERADIVPRQKS